MSTYLVYLSIKGHGIDEGKRALYGFNHLEGFFHKILDALPRSARALKGWSRREPGEVRDGIPEEATNRLFEDLILHKEFDAALCILVLFDSYMRVAELSFLRREHVFPPTRPSGGMQHWVLEAFPSLWADQCCSPRTSKTHGMDACVMLDDQSRDTAKLALSIAYKRAHSGELFLKTSPDRLRQLMSASGKRRQLTGMRPSPHRLRHGGASQDFLDDRKSLKAIQLRGHWRSWASVRRYGKPASLLKQWDKVSPGVRAKARGAEAGVMALLKKMRPLV